MDCSILPFRNNERGSEEEVMRVIHGLINVLLQGWRVKLEWR